MDNTLLIGLLAAGGAAAAFWSQLKGILTRLASLVVGMVTVEDTPLSWAMKSYCFSNLKQSRLGVRNFAACDIFVRPLSAVLFVGYERIGASQTVFWKGFRPLWVSYDPAKDRGLMHIGFIRGTFNVDRLMQEALDHYNDLARGTTVRRYRVTHVVGRSHTQITAGSEDKSAERPRSLNATNVLYDSRVLKWQLDELGPELSRGSAVDTLVLPGELRAAIEEARFWRKSETWYRDRGIPWKRGWLLHGVPGTGKTSLARAVAEDLDLPIFAYDLSSLSNEELREAWSKMRREAPCMALLEDIDGVFHGRSNVSTKRDPLTFDALLNCIDGVERTDGLFLAITTNDLSKIDPAIGAPGHLNDTLSSRPGRVDRVIELKAPDGVGLTRVCERILANHPELWAETVREGVRGKETVAQFQERCARIALSMHWSEVESDKWTGTGGAAQLMRESGRVRLPAAVGRS